MLKVTVFSGGRGSNSLVKELIKDDTIKLSLIVNAYDDGKSTGQIRTFFNMLGPSDIRKNQENLMTDNFKNYKIWSSIFKYRFSNSVKHDQCISMLNEFVKGKRTKIGDVEMQEDELIDLIRKLLIFQIVLYQIACMLEHMNCLIRVLQKRLIFSIFFFMYMEKSYQLIWKIKN